MPDGGKAGPTRVSRIVLIKDTQSLIFNDKFIIRYLNRSAFLIVWTLCKALCTDEEVQKLGGLDSGRLFELSAGEGLKLTSEASLVTLWRDVVELRRPRMPWTKFYELKNLSRDKAITLESLPNQDVGTLLQSIFHKTSPPPGSQLHKNVRLFAVKAIHEQIAVYQNEHEIDLAHGAKPLSSNVTRYRQDRKDVGYIGWTHQVAVNDNGSSDSVVSVDVVNLGTKPLAFISLPIWADTAEDAEKRKLKAWTADDQEMPVEPLVGEKKAKKYEFCLRLPAPVLLGKDLKFSFTYHTPHAFEEGRNYFEWYFDYPQCQYKVELCFSESWTIKSPVIFDGDEEDLFPATIKNSRTLLWSRYFPEPGHQYRIEFFASKTKGHQA